jgi:hypothetical protein
LEVLQIRNMPWAGLPYLRGTSANGQAVELASNDHCLLLGRGNWWIWEGHRTEVRALGQMWSRKAGT